MTAGEGAANARMIAAAVTYLTGISFGIAGGAAGW
jgi:hypothetical protein